MFTPYEGTLSMLSFVNFLTSALKVRVSMGIIVLRAYDCIADVMKPCGKKKDETQYDSMVPLSTHFLKNATL